MLSGVCKYSLQQDLGFAQAVKDTE